MLGIKHLEFANRTNRLEGREGEAEDECEASSSRGWNCKKRLLDENEKKAASVETVMIANK